MTSRLTKYSSITMLCALSMSCHTQSNGKKETMTSDKTATKSISQRESAPLSTLSKKYKDKLKLKCEDKDKDKNGNCIIPNNPHPQKPPNK